MKRVLWIVVLASVMMAPAFAAEELYNSHGRRDPFIPLIGRSVRAVSGLEGVVSAEELKVEGIMYQKGASIVIVNGSVLKEGEASGSVKVLEIKPEGVLFLISGVETFKPLYQDDENNPKP